MISTCVQQRDLVSVDFVTFHTDALMFPMFFRQQELSAAKAEDAAAASQARPK